MLPVVLLALLAPATVPATVPEMVPEMVPEIAPEMVPEIATRGATDPAPPSASVRPVVAPRLSTDARRRRSWTNIGKFRRGAVAALGVGTLGLAGTVGLQFGRAYLLGRCVRSGDPDSAVCIVSDLAGDRLKIYSTFGMAMMIAGSAGAGGLFGNAAATRDVEVRGVKPKVPSFSKFTGLVTMGLSAAWAVGRNIHYHHQELRCEGDDACIAKVRPKRWLANDIATLGVSFGAGLVGYSLAYERQARGLMAVRMAPAVGPDQVGVSLSGSF